MNGARDREGCLQQLRRDLKIGADTRFVTCAYCDTQLEVKRADGAAFTSVKESIENLAGDLAVIKLERRIERLDRDWERTRETLMLRGENGALRTPDAKHASLLMGAAVVLGLGFAVVAPTMFEHSSPVGLLGVAIAAAGVLQGLSLRAKADKYARALRRYEDARARLEEELHAAEE